MTFGNLGNLSISYHSSVDDHMSGIMQKSCISLQSAFQKCIFEFVMHPWDAKIETYYHRVDPVLWDPFKTLVTPNQQDGIPGLKAKICNEVTACHLNKTSNLFVLKLFCSWNLSWDNLDPCSIKKVTDCFGLQ